MVRVERDLPGPSNPDALGMKMWVHMYIIACVKTKECECRVFFTTQTPSISEMNCIVKMAELVKRSK